MAAREMFDFDFKDLEALAQSKCKNDLEEFPITSRYLYIRGNKMIFINKSRNNYSLCCTGSCGFLAYRKIKTFDILFFNQDLTQVIKQFDFYVKEINELYSAKNNEN